MPLRQALNQVFGRSGVLKVASAGLVSIFAIYRLIDLGHVYSLLLLIVWSLVSALGLVVELNSLIAAMTTGGLLSTVFDCEITSHAPDQ